ncbi:serine/threonine protein kinase [Pleomassaria siparia CBS 279.74]|uniref:Serine/threonine protein kinase n=1 Tax=Pleomassaria siparia CBS 279.74 TaxID=1314801 RepID=A0A6G1KE86_9PLEO|nr:serine/threonine protein kinase [Pleomassaria siparia CBS 279.74]
MNTSITEMGQILQTTAVGFGSEPLLVLPNGHVENLANGYIPLLVNFTFEDKAAKGLRKRTPNDKPEPPVYFSALELVRDYQMVLLCGGAGSGKTTFAKHLCYRLATTGLKEARSLPRNDFGAVREESWAEVVVPWHFEIDSPGTLKVAVESTVPRLVEALWSGAKETEATALVILDGIERAGDEAPSLLKALIDRVRQWTNVKLVVLGDIEVCHRWNLPSDIVRHDLLPLLDTQRRQALDHLTGIGGSKAVIGTGAAAAKPAVFALALEAADPGNQAEEVLDAWLSVVKTEDDSAHQLATQAFDQIERKPLHDTQESSASNSSKCTAPLLSCSRAIQRLLAARHLSRLDPETAVELFHRAPEIWGPIIHSLLQSTLPALERKKAGRVLSRLGDPRPLEGLARVDAGTFLMGSDSHPNSQPPEKMIVGRFRISIYVVVNRNYLTFIEQTGREWRSVDGRAADKRNAPATELTWHDANAYCSWLTLRWRASGQIGLDEDVRLPTELEWERASRGDLAEAGRGKPVWPWGSEWQDDAANSEETGFNETCAVGLFPRGCSPYGCHDMAGQVWEWCSTLWGEDMATPSFRYPYRADDGREGLNAAETVRRVLRGGCFSSGGLKVSTSYRGSLEPAGFWRGNGFRIVVAKSNGV